MVPLAPWAWPLFYSAYLAEVGVPGLGKRRAIFAEYRERCDILCLQETHSDSDTCGLWINEWGGRIIFSHGSSNSRGVAICAKKSFLGLISQASSDQEGRRVSCRIQMNDKVIYLVNVYGPNRDSPMFFENVIKTSFEQDPNLIVVGDFNTVLNTAIDRNTMAAVSNNNASNKIRDLCDELQLQDIWRVRNPDTRRYSWYRFNRQNNRFSASRLDYAIVSCNLAQHVHDTFYLRGHMTDHSAFFVGIQFKDEESRGPGFWKMNTSYLSNIEFVKSINAAIQETNEQYTMSDPWKDGKWSKKQSK